MTPYLFDTKIQCIFIVFMAYGVFALPICKVVEKLLCLLRNSLDMVLVVLKELKTKVLCHLQWLPGLVSMKIVHQITFMSIFILLRKSMNVALYIWIMQRASDGMMSICVARSGKSDVIVL